MLVKGNDGCDHNWLFEGSFSYVHVFLVILLIFSFPYFRPLSTEGSILTLLGSGPKLVLLCMTHKFLWVSQQ